MLHTSILKNFIACGWRTKNYPLDIEKGLFYFCIPLSSPSLLSILSMYEVFTFNRKPQVVRDASRVMGEQHSILRGAATSPNRALDHSVPSPVINNEKRGERLFLPSKPV